MKPAIELGAESRLEILEALAHVLSDRAFALARDRGAYEARKENGANRIDAPLDFAALGQVVSADVVHRTGPLAVALGQAFRESIEEGRWLAGGGAHRMSVSICRFRRAAKNVEREIRLVLTPRSASVKGDAVENRFRPVE
jgi:hypothetical protein